MTPEQLRQRRRERDRKILYKAQQIAASEIKRMTEEADAIDEHHRITGEIRGLSAQYEGSKEFCNYFGNHLFLAEVLAKMQQAGYKLKAHEHQMAFRGFKIPTPN